MMHAKVVLGGKGAGLVLMAKQGLNVPPGGQTGPRRHHFHP